MHQCLEAITEKWERPFYQPVSFNRETGDVSAGKWAVSVFNLTNNGNISKGGKGVLFIEYCPICGEKLED